MTNHALRSSVVVLLRNAGRPPKQQRSWRSTGRNRRRFSSEKHPVDNNNSNNSPAVAVVRPYSGSLPSPGYEWCRRCHIPSRRLQKPVRTKITSTAELPPCYSRRDSLCEPARRYYRRQCAHMAFWVVLVFGVLPPGVTFGGTGADGEDE